MKENTWIYNSNEETWMVSNSYETKEEAIQAGKEDYEGDCQFFVGQLKNMDIGVGVNVEMIIEDIAENVKSEVGEAADDYLNNVHEEHSGELEELLNDALHYWMDRYDYKPKYFRVDNVECIPLEEEG